MQRNWLYRLTETRYRERDSDPPYASSLELSLLTQRGWETTDYWDSRGFVGDSGVAAWVPKYGVLHADANTLMDKTDLMVASLGHEKTQMLGGQTIRYFLYQPTERK